MRMGIQRKGAFIRRNLVDGVMNNVSDCRVALRGISTAIVCLCTVIHPFVIKGGIHNSKVSMSRNDLPYSISDINKIIITRRGETIIDCETIQYKSVNAK